MEKEIGRFFCDETNSKLRIIPHKNKDKLEILNLVIDHFESNVFYSERRKSFGYDFNAFDGILVEYGVQ